MHKLANNKHTANLSWHVIRLSQLAMSAKLETRGLKSIFSCLQLLGPKRPGPLAAAGTIFLESDSDFFQFRVKVLDI